MAVRPCSGFDSKLTTGIAIGVGALTAIGLAYLYKKKLAESPPKRWRRVGEISDIICYPIKSCGPIRLHDMQCNVLGLEEGHIRDRVFMIITPEGQFITARTYPKLVQIQPKFNGDTMQLSAPGMRDIDIDMKRVYRTTPIRATVWQQGVDAIDCGEEVAIWCSRFILSEDFGMRLVFYPNTVATRPVRPKNLRYDTLTTVDGGALHDASSFMLMNEASLAELNSRLDNLTVTPLQFRPNFVVKGPAAYEEDDWQWIKIGNDVLFRNVKACTRCVFTNIDPETAKRNPNQEPLKTLKAYRSIIPDESPVMGIHIGVRKPGRIALGDAVYIGDN